MWVSHSCDLHLTTQAGANTEAHRRSYISLAHEGRNVSTTYTDPSMLDHLALSSHLSSHLSVNPMEAWSNSGFVVSQLHTNQRQCLSHTSISSNSRARSSSETNQIFTFDFLCLCSHVTPFCLLRKPLTMQLDRKILNAAVKTHSKKKGPSLPNHRQTHFHIRGLAAQHFY